MALAGRGRGIVESLEDHERVLALSRLVDRWAEENLAGEPDWAPLEEALPIEWYGGFMWMQRVEQDGVTVELYKHGITRRYLNLDHSGRAYRYTRSGYVEMPLDEAIDWVFDGVEEMGWSRETVYDDEFRAEKYRAFREAGWTVITARPGSSHVLDDQDEYAHRNDREQRE